MRRPSHTSPRAMPSALGIMARLAVTRLRNAGVEADPLLKRAGLTARDVDDRLARLSVGAQIKFLDLAAAALGDDLLGFHLAQGFDLRQIGLIYYVAASSDLLDTALARAARYSGIPNESVVLQYQREDDLVIRLRYAGIPRHTDRHQIEFWLASIVRACRLLVGPGLSLIRVNFAHHRPDSTLHAFQKFFATEVAFDAAEDAILLPGSAAGLRIVSADPYLNQILVAYCEEALAARKASSSALRSSVENAIVPLLPHGQAHSARIAESLRVSPRTLSRRLASEGMTFAGILEDLRADLASRYLDDPELTISQVAWLLGYQEVSAFTRAFKRRTGNTPSEARSLRRGS
jgi:AraC-like DNA-binding protein